MNALALSMALVIVAASAAKPVAPVPTPGEPATVKEPKTGYYTFSPPASWTRADNPKEMTKHEPRWAIPSKAGEPAVELVHRRLSIRKDSDDVREALDAWKKRGVTVTERTQPIPGSEATAKVHVTEHVKDGKAFLGAIVDLSGVDARTDGAYMRVDGALFELEGPEARVLAAKKDFDALVRSVGLRQL